MIIRIIAEANDHAEAVSALEKAIQSVSPLLSIEETTGTKPYRIPGLYSTEAKLEYDNDLKGKFRKQLAIIQSWPSYGDLSY